MIKLQAPYPALTTTSYLPNPTLGDTEAPVATIDVKYAMDGTRRTYVQTVEDRQLSYTFRLTRMKGLELEAFVRRHFADKLLLTNHRGEVWVVNFINNPFEIQSVGAWLGSPGNEENGVNLQFQGVEL